MRDFATPRTGQTVWQDNRVLALLGEFGKGITACVVLSTTTFVAPDIIDDQIGANLGHSVAFASADDIWRAVRVEVWILAHPGVRPRRKRL